MSVEFITNFFGNLKAIEKRCNEKVYPQSYSALLDLLFNRVVPLLEQQPKVGYDILARRPLTTHIAERMKRVRDRLGGGSLRELPLGDYLFLYVVQEPDIVFLIAVRHHNQDQYVLDAAPDSL